MGRSILRRQVREGLSTTNTAGQIYAELAQRLADVLEQFPSLPGLDQGRAVFLVERVQLQ